MSGTTASAKKVLVRLMNDPDVFDFPKPVELIQCAVQMLNDRDAIVFDFFAGSGTMAHAVLDLNERDGGRRRFILCQLPEPTSRDKMPSIATICRERVRRIGSAIVAAPPLVSQSGRDIGFRAFTLAESNFATWDGNASSDNHSLGRQLELHTVQVREGRSMDDQLYEILLKSGYALSAKVDQLTIAGKTVHSAASGAFLICLERQLTLDLIRAIADRSQNAWFALTRASPPMISSRSTQSRFSRPKGLPASRRFDRA